ncbi:MAG TPA: PDZ domain-containing protein, partial [Christiangramia sp.]|nr:PDZ domain-containing protein [Christiangramia sp.]
GSYIGYAFAVPSNNARKIVEDIMEFGDVQQGILGIRGRSLNNEIIREYDLNTSQGVMVAEVTPGSGAEKSGIRQKDIIRKIDNIDINKFSDLTGYINSKRPGDEVLVKLMRDGKEREVNVELTKLDTYRMAALGLEVANASPEELKAYKAPNGVRINRTLTDGLPSADLVGGIISEINGQDVSSVRDVEEIMQNRTRSNPIVIVFYTQKGEKQRMIWK